MEVLTETWPSTEVGSVIRFLRLKKSSAVEIYWQLVEMCGANIMSRKQVWVWCTEFYERQKSCARRTNIIEPNTSTTDWNVSRREASIQAYLAFMWEEIQQTILMWLLNLDAVSSRPVSKRWCTDKANAFKTMLTMWRNNMQRCLTMFCISLNSWIKFFPQKTCYFNFETTLVHC